MLEGILTMLAIIVGTFFVSYFQALYKEKYVYTKRKPTDKPFSEIDA